MKLLVKGWWALHSDSDPRWNKNGRSDEVGCFTIPTECKRVVEGLEKLLGPPPEDLVWSYMKE